MEKYIPKVGDVIENNLFPEVVVKMVSNETIGSCCYDRKYLLCPEQFIKEHSGLLPISDLEKCGRWVEIIGSEIPDMIQSRTSAPYHIEQIEACNIRQKTAKTITVYE